MLFKYMVFFGAMLGYCQKVCAQGPINPPPSGNQHSVLASGSPSHPSFQDLENCVAKIRQLNSNYKESGERLNQLKEEVDNDKRDSLWLVLKEDMEQQNKEQITLYADIENDLPEEFESLKNAAAYNKRVLEIQGKEIPDWDEYGKMEYYLESGKGNLRVFTDEHFAEAGREYFGNQSDSPLSRALLSDGYGDYLDQNQQELSAKTGHWQNKYGHSEFNRRQADISEAPAKKPFKLIEKNLLGEKPLRERLTAGIAINSLETLTEGFNLNLHIGFRLTHQFSLLAGPTWKKTGQNDRLPVKPIKEGAGMQAGARFSSSKWLGQATMERNRPTINYPSGAPVENYQGNVNYLLVGLGRTILLTNKWNAVVTGIYDLGFRHERRLHNSPFLLRMGIEFH